MDDILILILILQQGIIHRAKEIWKAIPLVQGHSEYAVPIQ